MSWIDDLLARHAPRGVTYKALGELAVVKTGPNVNKKIIAERPGPYPVINSGRDPLGYIDSFNAEDDPIGIASRGSVGLVTWTSGRFFRGNLNYSCTPRSSAGLDSRFLYYYLLCVNGEIHALATHQGIPALNAGALKTLRVPVPPLAVQHEIVRILDNFTELLAALEAELESRRRQYEYYRDDLLALSSKEARWVLMGDVGSFFGGLTGKSKADFAEGGARFVSYVNVFSNIAVDLKREDFVRVAPGERQHNLTLGDILFTGSSENQEEVGMSSVVTQEVAEPVYLNSFTIGYRLHDTELLEPGFAKHLFRSADMRAQIVKTANGVTRFNVSKGRLAKVQFPIPSRDDQRSIASILDKFDALVNDLSSGLPAEIAARRKQYEYYRDRLLTFEEAS